MVNSIALIVLAGSHWLYCTHCAGRQQLTQLYSLCFQTAVDSIVLILLAYDFGSIVLIVLPDGCRLVGTDCACRRSVAQLYSLCGQAAIGSIVLFVPADGCWLSCTHCDGRRL